MPHFVIHCTKEKFVGVAYKFKGGCRLRKNPSVFCGKVKDSAPAKESHVIIQEFGRIPFRFKAYISVVIYDTGFSTKVNY